MIPSMSYATKTKVKPCTECRVGTVANSKEDRRWKWQCKQVVPGALSECRWTNWSTYGKQFDFQCDEYKDYEVLSGVRSVYTVIQRRIGGGASTAANLPDFVQDNASGQITSTTWVVICTT